MGYANRVKKLGEAQQERMRLLEPYVQEDDICRKCMDYYKEHHEGKLCPTCEGSHVVQLRKLKADLEKEGNAVPAEDWNIFTVTKDPVLWAEYMLGVECRWYQLEMLRCTSQKKVSRCGRRIGKTVALGIDGLHLAATRPNQKIVIVAPLQSQVTVVFNVIRELIRGSQGAITVTRDVKQPHRIEFSNGSYLLGVTAGARVGMKGDKIRGEDATALYIDEADYLDKDTMESLLALFTSHPNCRLWASSTPKGSRNLFYEWCVMKESHGFKEFHFPSSVSPAWSAETEHMFRQQYSKSGYLHEFAAEFGDQETGVYQQLALNKSLQDYAYKDCTRVRKKGWLYTLGVDWNAAKNGVHMVGIEYNPDTTKMKVILHDEIHADEFTQTKAVQRIIRLHSKWDFDWIYVDKGFGDSQIEQLHLFGKKHPSSRLGKIVKGIAMQANIEVWDPFTKQPTKKNSKQMMVNLSARRVECDQCIFPKIEDNNGGLVHQMRNFEAERISRDGQPVYNTMEDHALVSWQLGIMALVMEYTHLGSPSYSSKVVFADIHGSKPKPIGQEEDERKAEKRKKRKRLIPTARANQLDIGYGRGYSGFNKRRLGTLKKRSSMASGSHSLGRRSF